ncbi:MAG: TonB-dependent receptor, partial [Vicinamibacterales bacterium]|nr:TonB-dependent receptor [Vicinamibacterales bacterium]
SGRTVYLSVSRGFKAGGFNPAAPAGSEDYGEEHAWNAEGGVKTLWANGRVSANAAVFRISWDDMQLNVPNPYVPAQFFIANVGHATSTGFELDVNARPRAGVDLFGTFGLTHGRFGAGSRSSGVDVTGNELPNAPGYTASLGLQCTQGVGRSMSGFGRAEVVFYGAYHYDDLNSAGQDAYVLANLRAGLRIGRVLVEGWVKNAFDTRYIPVAFAYAGLAPSGFLGENGRPRTFGVTTRVVF